MAINRKPYSEITEESGTQLKTVYICSMLYKSMYELISFFPKLHQIKPKFLNQPCNPAYNETFHLIYMTIKSNLIDLINLACR